MVKGSVSVDADGATRCGQREEENHTRSLRDVRGVACDDRPKLNRGVAIPIVRGDEQETLPPRPVHIWRKDQSVQCLE